MINTGTLIIMIVAIVLVGVAIWYFATHKPAAKVQFIVSPTPTVITNGMLVKGNATTDITLYMIVNGEKCALTLDVWKSEDYPAYTIVDSATLNAIPDGAAYVG